MGKRGKTYRVERGRTDYLTGRLLPVFALLVVAALALEVRFYAGWLTSGRVGTVRLVPPPPAATLPPRERVYFTGVAAVAEPEVGVARAAMGLPLRLLEQLATHVDATHADVLRSGGDTRVEERLALLSSAQAVVAEVSEPSFDLGYELAMAETLKLPVLALARGKPSESIESVRARLPAMLATNEGAWAPALHVYSDDTGAREAVDEFIAANRGFESRPRLSVQLSGKVSV